MAILGDLNKLGLQCSSRGRTLQKTPTKCLYPRISLFTWEGLYLTKDEAQKKPSTSVKGLKTIPQTKCQTK